MVPVETQMAFMEREILRKFQSREFIIEEVLVHSNKEFCSYITADSLTSGLELFCLLAIWQLPWCFFVTAGKLGLILISDLMNLESLLL